MSKMIAITGGIASGKSTVLKTIKELGYTVYSCDEIYKELTSDSSYIVIIEKEFPGVVCDGKIDRSKLAQIVFSNETARKRLNAIAHPLIMERLLKRMQNAKEMLVFAEVPLLFEGNFQSLFDEIIVVYRNKKERVDAICQRDCISEKEAYARINSQFDYDDSYNLQQIKESRVFILENKNDELSLRKKIEALIGRL